MPIRAALTFALAAALLSATPAPTFAGGEPGRLRGRVIRTLDAPVVASCNRAAVRDCQADANLYAQVCQARPDRLACIDQTLGTLQMCWAATGCF